MAKATIELTGTFQQIAAGLAVFTVKQRGAGQIVFNETASDTNANEMRPEPGDQIEQRSVVSTFARATGTGWVILADGSL